MAHQVPRKFVSLEEAAALTSLSARTIRRRIADGTLTAYRLGNGPIRLRLDELEAALQPIPTVGQVG